jgi:hypothetical protein
VLATISVCLIAFVFAYRARDQGESTLALALCFPAVILASPLAYLHHMVYLIPSVVIWLTWAWTRGRSWVLGSVVCLATASGMNWPSLYDDLGSAFSGVGARAVNLYAVVALYGIGIWVCLVDRRSPVQLPGVDRAA